MRILFVADGRSAITANWLGYLIEHGYEVNLVSTYPAQPELKLASLHILSVAFSSAADTGGSGRGGLFKKITTAGMRTRIRQWLGPMTLPRATGELRAIIEEVQPDLVHALRIPYEGMLAAAAKPEVPLLVSVWGNDFTLHARTTPLMGTYTRRTMKRADALLADCRRDIRLAHEWGFPQGRPEAVLPGGGGIQLDLFYPPEPMVIEPVVINPRGLRAYVRNDIFFKAMHQVVEVRLDVQVICPAMQGEPQAENWIKQYGLMDHVQLLPAQSRAQMAQLFRQAMVAVSPSEHDGTPNTLLEAMACGCLPVAGDIESVREWLVDGENALLVNPADSQALAAAILRALDDLELRRTAASRNQALVAEQAEHSRVMAEAEAFYKKVVAGK
jgi:glycosyltransferase involved in cell wall biosynthesis